MGHYDVSEEQRQLISSLLALANDSPKKRNKRSVSSLP
jgi:hypothetical protein